MRKYLLITTSLILMFIGSLLLANPVNAKSFDPGFIISDSIFTNSTSMSADAIQNFINIKGANCTNGQMPCLKNYKENGKSAGTIIAEKSKQYSINPQVLIVTLQKEQGLVTGSKPTNTQYRTATGYGCPDSTPGVCDNSYYGFTNQLDWAAKMFRSIMNDSPTWYTPYNLGVNYVQYHPNASCGGTSVNIQNRATKALYNYTPYQPNSASLSAGYGTGDSCSSYGNRNFWLYFNDWFGSSTSSILIQSPQSPAVYLQSGDTRYGIPNWGIIDAYGFGRFGVTAVSNSYMNALHDGGTLNTTFSNKSQPGPAYLADNGYRFGFASHQQCIDWGFPKCTNPDSAKPLEPAVFDLMYTYGALSNLMLNGSHVFLVKDGNRHAFLSDQARKDSGYIAVKHTPITNDNNIIQRKAEAIPQNNSLVSIKNTPVIYAYANGKFFALSSNSFKHLSNSGFPVNHDTVSSYTKTPPNNTGTISSLVGFSDGSSYFISEDQKIDYTATKEHWPKAPVYDDVKQLITKKPADLKTKQNETYQTKAGAILKIENGQYRIFQSLDDYFQSGYTTPTRIDNSVLSVMKSGDPVFAPGSGSLFQLNDKARSSLILTLSTDDTICQIYSLPQLALYNMNSSSVPRVSLQNVESRQINILSTTTYDESGRLHIRYGNIHSTISAGELKSTWGIAQEMPLCKFSNRFFDKHSKPIKSPKFVRNEHTGIIYFGENGKKRPIYSYDAFLRMGGNSSNTLDVSMQFLVSSPDGVPVTK